MVHPQFSRAQSCSLITSVIHVPVSANIVISKIVQCAATLVYVSVAALGIQHSPALHGYAPMCFIMSTVLLLPGGTIVEYPKCGTLGKSNFGSNAMIIHSVETTLLVTGRLKLFASFCSINQCRTLYHWCRSRVRLVGFHVNSTTWTPRLTRYVSIGPKPIEMSQTRYSHTCQSRCPSQSRCTKGSIG